MSEDLYVTAEEAAALLGVSPATLYAYVSRKKIRSFATPGSRKRRYWRPDVASLVSLSRKSTTPSNPDIGQTAITLLTDDGTFYRGHNVIDLAASESLENVAGLLWQVDPAQAFSDRLPEPAENQDSILGLLKTVSRQDRALALMPLVERANPRAFDISVQGFTQNGASMLRWLTAILFGQARPSTDPLHVVIARAAGVSDEVADLVRRALILAADHQLGDTTRAVRSAAQTGITPYGAAMVGMVASSGQYIRVGRTAAIRRLVTELLQTDRPEEAIIGRYRAGESIPGFGSLLPHRSGDDRSRDLLAAAGRVFSNDPEFDRLARGVALTAELTGAEPEFMVPLIFISHKLGLASEPMAFPLVGRTVGWIAHALEAVHGDRPVRTRAEYVGPLP